MAPSPTSCASESRLRRRPPRPTKPASSVAPCSRRARMVENACVSSPQRCSSTNFTRVGRCDDLDRATDQAAGRAVRTRRTPGRCGRRYSLRPPPAGAAGTPSQDWIQQTSPAARRQRRAGCRGRRRSQAAVSARRASSDGPITVLRYFCASSPCSVAQCAGRRRSRRRAAPFVRRCDYVVAAGLRHAAASRRCRAGLSSP